MQPWFDPTLFGAIYGSVVGGVGGSLFGIIVGRIPDPPQTESQRRRLFGAISFLFIFGLANLVIAIVALAMEQPWPISYPFFLIGAITVLISVGVGKKRLRKPDPTDTEP